VIVYFYSLFIHLIQTHGPYNKGNQIMQVHQNYTHLNIFMDMKKPLQYVH